MKYQSAIDPFARSYVDAQRRLGLARPDLVEVVAAYDQSFHNSTLGRGGAGTNSTYTVLTTVFGRYSRLLIYRAGRFDYEACVSGEKRRELVTALNERKLPDRTDCAEVGGFFDPQEN